MTTDNSFTNREKRFEVNQSIGFDAIVNRAGSDESVFYASLIDFSRRGGKFELPFCARFDELLKIKFEFKNSDLRYEGTGRVRHMRNVGENRWQVGCSLDPTLPEEIIGHLAERNNQERRQHPRFEVFGSGILRRQGVPGGCEAVIKNISKGGFCIFVPDEHEIGEKVDFVVKHTDVKVSGANENSDEDSAKLLSIGARVRWQSRNDDGFTIGCSFTEANSYSRMVDFLVDDQKKSEDKTSWLVMAAAVIAIAIPIVGSLIFGSGSDSKLAQASMIPAVNKADIGSENAELTSSADEESPNEVANLAQTEDTLFEEVVQETELPVENDEPAIAAKETSLDELAEKSNQLPEGIEVNAEQISGVDVPPMKPPANSSRRVLHHPDSNRNRKQSSPPPESTAPRKPLIPAVLTRSGPSRDELKRADKGSSRRLKSRRPIIVESEAIIK